MTDDFRLEAVETTNKSSQNYDESASDPNNSNIKDKIDIPSQDTDGVNAFSETTYIPNFRKWHGYYRRNSGFQAIIDTLAKWCVGKGFKADEKTKAQMKKFVGFGKDSPNGIIKNQIRTSLIAGDSFAEIIKSRGIFSKSKIINLKPLNPGSIQIVVNEKGFIDRYEQVSKNKEVNKVYKPNQILHISHNRIGDEVHGIPFGEKLEELLNMKLESMRDLRTVFQRYVKPLTFYHLNTDDETEVNKFLAKTNTAYKKTENIALPANTVEKIDQIAVPQYSTLDPLPWIKYLSREITTDSSVPEVVRGWGEDTTEASSKVIYLAFQQTVEDLQLEIETQLEMQTGLKINLEFPASLEPEMQRDEKKDGELNNMENKGK